MSPLRPWTLVRVFLRTFFLQAGFSLEAMQTLGLLYSLEPALRELYPDRAERKGAMRRHLVPFIHGWSAVVFVVAYNLVHLTLRLRLFWLGWTLGDGLVARVSAVRLPTWSTRLRTVAAAACGGLGAWLAVTFGRQVGGADTLGLTVGALACGVATLALVERGAKPLWLMYGLAAAAMVAGSAQ